MKLTITAGFARADESDEKLTDRIAVLETTGKLLFGEIEFAEEGDEPFIIVPDNASPEKLQEFFRRSKLIGFTVARSL